VFFVDRGLFHHVTVSSIDGYEWHPASENWSASNRELRAVLMSRLRHHGLRSSEARAFVAQWRDHLLPPDDQIRAYRFLRDEEIRALVQTTVSPQPRSFTRMGLELHVMSNAIPSPPLDRMPVPAPSP
jgi:hypothetical protein